MLTAPFSTFIQLSGNTVTGWEKRLPGNPDFEINTLRDLPDLIS
jgi:hypothetical protein